MRRISKVLKCGSSKVWVTAQMPSSVSSVPLCETIREEVSDISKNYKLKTINFLWDNWNIISEQTIDHQSLTTNSVSYVWGIDLSGSLQGAGGVGGLLAVIKDGETFYPTYDANGNVSEYVDNTGTIVAHREYDAFGNTIVATGDADAFLHWFSTKPWCESTQLLEYVFRPNKPSYGRWLNRDPIGERGGLNLYAFCENGPANHIDPLGLDTNDITKSSNPAVTGGKKCCCSTEDKLKELEKMIKNAVEKTQNDSISVSVVLTRSQLIQFANSKDPIKIPEPEILHREYAGYICCDEATGEVSSTGPFPGTWRLSNGDYSENPNVLANATGFRSTSGNVGVDDNAKCGKGLTPVAYYHSHPPESQEFSEGDKGSFLPIALGIPGWNKWLLFNPTTRKQFTYEYTEDIK